MSPQKEQYIVPEEVVFVPGGRPPAENPRDHLLSEVRVTKGEMLVVELKAALYTRGNVSRLVREALRVYQGQVQPPLGRCTECGSRPEIRETSVEAGSVVFHRVPAYICPQCGHGGVEIRILTALEKIAPVLEVKEISLPEVFDILSAEKEPVAAT